MKLKSDYCLSFQLWFKAEMDYGDSTVYFPFTFTQQDIDNVLYGYVRTPEKTANGFALSGIYGGMPTNGKRLKWNRRVVKCTLST